MSIEEIIKVLGEIAEGHEKLSADVCARADIKAMWEGHAKGIRQSIALLKAHLDAKPNDPLTLEELREMDGEPVYSPCLQEWGLVAAGGFTVTNMVYICDKAGNLRPATVWLACGPVYRRRPEEVENG